MPHNTLSGTEEVSVHRPWYVLVRVSLLWTDTMASLRRTTFNRGWLTGSRGSVHLSSRREHGSIQAGMVQEELRALHRHLKATSRILASRQLGLKAHIHSATPTPTGPHLLIVPLSGPSIYKPSHSFTETKFNIGFPT